MCKHLAQREKNLLCCQVHSNDLNKNSGPQLNTQRWDDQWYSVVGILQKGHDKTLVVGFDWKFDLFL